MKTLEDMEFDFDWSSAAKVDEQTKISWLLNLLNYDKTHYDATFVMSGDTMMLKLIPRDRPDRAEYYDLAIRRYWVEVLPAVDIHHDDGE